MKKTIPILFLCFFTGLLSAQNQPDSLPQLKKTYKDYFQLNREAVFLQLNKTKVLPKESLWFSAYVYDPRVLKPNVETTNLHVNIYDESGKLKKAKTVFINNGKGEGYFKLDTLNFKPGNYLVKAFTRYMDNFPEDLAFSQGFKILGESEQSTEKGKENHYDLQLLPEGGHLLANAQNTIGVKLIDGNGKGIFFSDAKVLNSENHVVTTFKANQFGMAKFNLTFKSGENYTVKVQLENGKPLSVKLQKPDLHGLAFSINNLVANTVYVSVRTNPSSLNQVAGKKFYVAFHREGLLESVPFVFPKNKTNITLQISKKFFSSGVNIITIFNQDFKPLLERQVFYAKNLKRKHITTHLFKNHGDSLSINLSSKLKQGNHAMSISVLPGNTKSYTPDNDIFSAFYIEPFIKGNLEHGSYYFSEGNARRKAYDLDLLLLTQGWSKYKWRDIFKRTPTGYYKPERGFTISGQVSKRDKETEKQVMIKGKKSSLFEVADLDTKNHFSVDKLFVLDNSKVSFGLMNNKKKKVKQSAIYTTVNPQRDTKPLGKMPRTAFAGLESQKTKAEISSIPKDFIQSAQRLDSVFIKSKKAKEDRDNIRTSILAHQKIVDEDMAMSYIYITDYIASQGFRVNRSFTSVSITTMAALSLRGPAHPLVRLDGMDIGGDLMPLTTLQTSDVKSITINKTGLGGGMNAAGGIISIVTKSGDFYSGGKPSESTKTLKMNNGFAENKEFYAPKYSNYSSETFSNYGVIDWFPNVQMNAGGAKTIKIFNTIQPSVKLYIEGMTADGSLISEELTVKTR